jgi:hypothetical protein
MEDAECLVEPTYLDVFGEFTVHTRQSFADFIDGLDKLDDGSDDKKNELYERFKAACNLDALKKLGGEISEYKRSVSAANGGFYVALAAGGVCAAAGLLSHFGGTNIPYDVFEKVCKIALMAEGGGILSYLVNAPLIPDNEQYVKESMANLFGEDAIRDEYAFKAGIRAVSNTHSYIVDHARVHDILI